jgi:hypothetical protein
MSSSGMLGCVAFARIDLTEKLIVLRSVRRLLVTASVVPSSPVLVALMMEATCSSETSVFTRATRHNIPEDGIHQTATAHTPFNSLPIQSSHYSAIGYSPVYDGFVK